MWNSFSATSKNKLLHEAPQLLERIQYLKRELGNDSIYYYGDILQTIIRLFKDVFFLWNEDESKWEITNVYAQDFFLKLNEIYERIQNRHKLLDTAEWGVFDTIDAEISRCIQEWLQWVEKEWPPYEADKIHKFKKWASKYIKPWNVLDVDKILEALNSHWSWNEDHLIFAFYTAECDKKELEKLQRWVLQALEAKFKRLDTVKVFTIIEFILPYIFNGYEDINFEFPELFRPEYLSKIRIYDLTIEGFTNQIHELWPKNGWPLEIQEKLIEQFMIYGTTESWQIWFWQGSEQLWYWSSVTGEITPKNYTYYLKDANLWEDKRPTPKILTDTVHETTAITHDTALHLLEE